MGVAPLKVSMQGVWISHAACTHQSSSGNNRSNSIDINACQPGWRREIAARPP